MRYDYSNYFRNAIYLSFVPLSNYAKDTLLELINILVDSLNTTDFQTIKNSILRWEEEVQANKNNFTDEEFARLLASSSIARYGSYIWLIRANTVGSQFARGSFWNWVGAVIGAIAAVVVTTLLWGPLTVGGFILFGIAGAVLGYYVVEEFFQD